MPDDTRTHLSVPAENATPENVTPDNVTPASVTPSVAPAVEPAAPRPERPVYTPEAAAAPGVHDRVVEALTTIYDPEIPVNIYEMGLVYDVDVSADGDVKILMTLTSPTCPVAESLPPEVEAKVGAVEGVRDVKVELTWDPPWTPEKMSEAAKLELGYL
ncbi:MAG: SUF system Fe-S cluster assembly protein [Gemmatimonas sp.]